MPTYPEDEFDRLPPTGRRGAHRQESTLSQRSAYVLIAIVAIVAVLLVVGVVNIIRTSFHDPEEQVQEPPAATETDSPGEDGTDEGEDATAEVDKESVVVSIQNISGVNGAAAAFQEAIEANGWTVQDVGTLSSPESVSTVYYSAREHEAQAAALAEELGVEQTEESAEYPGDLTLVLASDLAADGPQDAATDGAENGEEPAAPQG
jgi:biopolymer transport protein ExbD